MLAEARGHGEGGGTVVREELQPAGTGGNGYAPGRAGSGRARKAQRRVFRTVEPWCVTRRESPPGGVQLGVCAAARRRCPTRNGTGETGRPDVAAPAAAWPRRFLAGMAYEAAGEPGSRVLGRRAVGKEWFGRGRWQRYDGAGAAAR